MSGTERTISGLLILVGLVNGLPVAGVLSADVLADAYGIAAPAGDLLVLMRHRALLLGILGTIIIVSAFRRHLQPTAIAAGLLSMLGFVALAVAQGEVGAMLHKVVVIDVVASIGLVGAAFLRFRKSNGVG